MIRCPQENTRAGHACEAAAVYHVGGIAAMVVASWQDDLRQLDYGIEQEQFIFHLDGTPPSREETIAVFETLATRGMTPKAYHQSGELLAVKREMPGGPLVMKNDFCSHIFEIAFPPVRSVDEFTEIYHEAEVLATEVLAGFGLRVRPGGSLAAMPEEIVLRASDSDDVQKRMDHYDSRPLPKRPFSHRFFFAGMCSIHCHLNILDDALYSRLPAMYSVEYLVPLLYSESPVFNGRRAHCVRPLMYRDGFCLAYRASAIPDPIPTTRTAYRAFIAGSQGFIRDYTFIAPSWRGTVEFRTACVQPSLDELIEVLALRVALVLGVSRGYWHERPNLHALFWNACLTGTAPQAVLDKDYAMLTRLQAELPEDLQVPLRRVLNRFEGWRQMAA
ncbi:MAG: hypothetical protein ACYC6A_23730 [Armatimonadota bacterium]